MNQNNQNMANKSTYSHTFVVGKLASNIQPADVERTGKWTRTTLKRESSDWKELTFDSLKATYYPAFLNSTLETEGFHTEQDFPGFLKDVCRYDMKMEQGQSLRLKKEPNDYPCRIDSVSLFFYPCDITFFVIEIDDSGTDLDDLTLMHSQWKEWRDMYERFQCNELDELLEPLRSLACGDKSAAHITADGTKPHLYQIVQTDDKEIKDDLLFELGTFMPIGVVKHAESLEERKRRLKPTNKYYQHILENNTVAAFYNWKALALNDSFTVLASSENFGEWEQGAWNSIYFPLLYMRCLFEKTYCFNRNDRYRNNTEEQAVETLLTEIGNMERYYFYEDISYNFLPPMIYKTMARGMDLKTERDELTEHIKYSLRDESRKQANVKAANNNKIIIWLTALAALAALGPIWDFVDFITDGSVLANCIAAGVFVLILLYFVIRLVRNRI